jgi:hypothetical protein
LCILLARLTAAQQISFSDAVGSDVIVKLDSRCRRSSSHAEQVLLLLLLLPPPPLLLLLLSVHLLAAQSASPALLLQCKNRRRGPSHWFHPPQFKTDFLLNLPL